MPDAILQAIADLQREKRANDPVAEPIIMQNADLQAALAEIEGAIGGLANIPPTGIGSILYQNGAIFASPSPLPVLYGGVGTNNFGTGLGIVCSPSATGSLDKVPFPTTGIAVVDNTGAAFAPSLTYADGTWTPTDLSGAGLTFTPTTARYQQIGGWVLLTLDLTFPTTGSSATAYIGGLPVAPNPSFTGGTGVGTSNGSATCLAMTAGTTPGFVFQNISGTNFANSAMSAHAVRFQFSYHI